MPGDRIQLALLLVLFGIFIPVAIHTGLNASNVIAVVANGNTLDLYVNMQKIASVTDSTYNHGIIGLIADPTNNPTELVYINAKGWKF